MIFYSDTLNYDKNIAIVTESGEQITYEVMLKDADGITDGIMSRSLVFLVCENCYESIAAYVGFLRKKAVSAMVNPKIDDEMLEALLKSYHPQYIFCRKDWHIKGTVIKNFREYHLIKTENNKLHKINPELAVLITTSGSTGSPKLVMQTYNNINSNAVSIAQYLNITPTDRAITTMPMSYTYGLSIIQSHLLMGARIITTEKTLMDKDFWRLFKEQKATTFGGVPYIYEMLKRLRFGKMELPSLRYITQAGGKLSKELALEFSEICRDKGIKLIIMYGQTEATARMAYLPWEKAFEKAGSIGIAIPGGKFSLIDANGIEINQPDTVGELVYTGENVTLGYALTSEDLDSGDQFCGVLKTGDMAKRDRDGYYTIVGRKKRFLKIYGNRVNLDEIEGMLNSEGYKCVCGGRDDLLKIYIVEADEKALGSSIEFISAKTGLSRSAFKAISINEIPRNESGKVLYSKLEELYD